MTKDQLINNNPNVPADVYDIEVSQELADMYLEFIEDITINPCIDCGIEVDDLDNEYCDDCWDLWREEFKAATGKYPELITA